MSESTYVIIGFSIYYAIGVIWVLALAWMNREDEPVPRGELLRMALFVGGIFWPFIVALLVSEWLEQPAFQRRPTQRGDK